MAAAMPRRPRRHSLPPPARAEALVADGARLRRLGVAADDGDVGLDGDERRLPPSVLDPKLDRSVGRVAASQSRGGGRRRPHPRPRRDPRLEPLGRILGVGEGVNLDARLLGLARRAASPPTTRCGTPVRASEPRRTHRRRPKRASAARPARRGKRQAARPPRAPATARRGHWRRRRGQRRRRSRARIRRQLPPPSPRLAAVSARRASRRRRGTPSPRSQQLQPSCERRRRARRAAARQRAPALAAALAAGTHRRPPAARSPSRIACSLTARFFRSAGRARDYCMARVKPSRTRLQRRARRRRVV